LKKIEGSISAEVFFYLICYVLIFFRTCCCLYHVLVALFSYMLFFLIYFFDGHFNQVVDDTAELYVTHSASLIMSAPQKTKTIIIDVITYFFERQHMLNDHKVAQATQSEKPSAKIVLNPSYAGARGSKCSPPADTCKDAHIPAEPGLGGSKCFPTVGVSEDGHIPARSGLPSNDAMSGDTVRDESSGVGGGSTPGSVAETELASPSQLPPTSLCFVPFIYQFC
jgi:hypothetical protein